MITIQRAGRDALASAAAVLALLVGGCSDDGPTTETPAGDYALAVDPTELTIVRGSSNSAAVSIDRTSPFAGEVALALVNPPAGITGAF